MFPFFISGPRVRLTCQTSGLLK